MLIEDSVWNSEMCLSYNLKVVGTIEEGLELKNVIWLIWVEGRESDFQIEFKEDLPEISPRENYK